MPQAAKRWHHFKLAWSALTDTMDLPAHLPSTLVSKRPADRRLALVLQGGGALGAYQAGVFEALDEADLAPEWVAGTSIGAINGAIIAGGPRGERLDRLRYFWRSVAKPGYWGDPVTEPTLMQWFSWVAAMQAVLTGQGSFFRPRLLPPIAAAGLDGARGASYYDTAPLRDLLLDVVDFDYLNGGHTRYSLGAVHVTTGRLRYFDTRFMRIRVEHIMASGALPPGFPAVEVDGELWWDGGIYSNTPLEIVLDDLPQVSTLCFMVDLFNAAGPAPTTIPEAIERHKDIMFATRSHDHIEQYARMHKLRVALGALYERLPVAMRADPELAALAESGCRTTMEIVHLGFGSRQWELATKDVDFSTRAIEERWEKGYRDATDAIARAPWMAPVSAQAGVVIHDAISAEGAS